MKKVIKFLKGVKANKNGLEEFQDLKPELSEEEAELINVVLELMADIAHWAAEQTLCAAGILVEAKDDYDPKAIVKAMKIAAKFAISPMLILRLIHSIGLDIKPGELLSTLAAEYSTLTQEGEDKEDTCEPQDSEETIEDIQKQLSDMIRKFGEN